MEALDPCLDHARQQWLPLLQEGEALLERSEAKAALAPLGESIRISASFHPLFHFLESGLNTELAVLYASRQEWAEAERLFTRAVFLHHDNDIAIRGKEMALEQRFAPLPDYGTLRLSAPLTPPEAESGLHVLHRRARRMQDAAQYHAAIDACESAHQRYHQLAALPWLARARCFTALGEDILARNDIRHGMDLDRRNPDLLALSLELAA